MSAVDFNSLAQRLAPTLQALEEKRQELLKKGRSDGMLYGSIFMVVGVIALFLLEFVNVLSLILIAGLAILIFFVCIGSKSNTLSSYYKEEAVKKIIHAFCPGASYSPAGGISESVFRNCGLFESPDRYHAEDLIEGCLDKTSFRCSEVHAQERRAQYTKKGVRYYWVDIFKGFFFVADFHKDFQGETIIKRDSLIKIDMNGSRVKMENPEFEKEFDVHSTDQVEARYLITPSMMERLLKLDAIFNKGITVSFRNSTILVAIPDSKNRFEASIWTSMTDAKVLKSDFTMLQSLLAIVNELNLNTRIWTKE